MDKNNFVLIHNWSVTTRTVNPYTPPELIPKCLRGIAINHPKHPGKEWECITSRIINVDGRFVETENRTYKLGKISPKYREWLKKNRPNWDFKNPITMLKR